MRGSDRHGKDGSYSHRAGEHLAGKHCAGRKRCGGIEEVSRSVGGETGAGRWVEASAHPGGSSGVRRSRGQVREGALAGGVEYTGLALGLRPWSAALECGGRGRGVEYTPRR